MIKKIATSIVCFSLLICNAFAETSPKDIEGYGQTKWGMTLDQAIDAEEGRVERLDKPEKYKNGIGLASIKNIEINNSKFKVSYIFDEVKSELQQVSVVSLERKNHLINASTFSSLNKLLTEKYGEPSFKEELKVSSWKLSKTTIELTYMNIPGVVTVVGVTYTPSKTRKNIAKDL